MNTFESLYRHTLNSKLIKRNIKIKGYKPKESDIQDELFSLEEGQRLYDIDFQIYKKDVHIIKGQNSMVPVVTTIEQILDSLTHEVIKVIKTLRVFDDKNLKEVHSFLLEEIDVKKLNIKNYDLRLTLI